MRVHGAREVLVVERARLLNLFEVVFGLLKNGALLDLRHIDLTGALVKQVHEVLLSLRHRRVLIVTLDECFVARRLVVADNTTATISLNRAHIVLVYFAGAVRRQSRRHPLSRVTHILIHLAVICATRRHYTRLVVFQWHCAIGKDTGLRLFIFAFFDDATGLEEAGRLVEFNLAAVVHLRLFLLTVTESCFLYGVFYDRLVGERLFEAVLVARY